MSSYVPHRPHATQAAFLLLEAVREVLFGGAAGGGKSDALLMAALQYVDVPGYAAVLFRRTYQDLNQPDALIPRSKTWLKATDAHWDKELHQWTFPSGALVKFAYLQHEDDVFNYQGAAYQFIGFDELTQFTQHMYDYLHGRLRKPEGMDVPLRMRGSANPGGLGHVWVKAKFIDVKPNGEVAFVPSKLEDNPSLNKAEYEKSLGAIADPVLRLQLRHGDWDVRPAGKLFKREWFQVVDEAPAGLRWLRYWDLAATEEKVGPRGKPKNNPDWTAGAKVAVRKLKDGAQELWVRDVRRIRGTPREVETFVKATADEDGKAVPIWLEEEGGSSGKNTTFNYASRVLFGFTVRGHRKTGSKAEMWGPVSAQAQAGNVKLVRAPWNGWWVEEAVAAPNPGVHDDGLDAVSGGMSVGAVAEPSFNIGSYR